MAELTNDEIAAYAKQHSIYNPGDGQMALVAQALNQAGIQDGVRGVMRVERNEFKWPEPFDDIHTDRRRKEIIADMSRHIEPTRNLLGKIYDIPDSKPIIGLSASDFLSAIVFGFGGTAIVGSGILKVIHMMTGVNYDSWAVFIPAGLATAWGVRIFSVKGRRSIAADIANNLANTATTYRDRLERIKSELEETHHIDIIRARELSNEGQKSAVQTATKVGEVTKKVAEETAEITRTIIKEGKQLRTEHAAEQVKTIDDLADRLAAKASQPLEPKPATDDRDARIAALQAEIAKAEEIKALEEKLASLKGNA